MELPQWSQPEIQPGGNSSNLPVVHGAPVDWVLLDCALDVTDEWLETPQLPTAKLRSHFGEGLKIGGGIYLTVCPGAFEPAMHAKIVPRFDPTPDGPAAGIALISWHHTTYSVDYSTPDQVTGKAERVAFREYPEYTAAIEARIFGAIEFRWPVVSVWRHNRSGLSVLIEGGKPAAVATANTHRQSRTGGTFTPAVPPVFPVFVDTAPGSAVPTEHARNCEAVAVTIERTAGLLAELGIHAKSVHAGSLGSIDGPIGARTFTPSDTLRVGVALPAEAFEELVRLALAGYEQS
jgi:hypothetical protein